MQPVQTFPVPVHGHTGESVRTKIEKKIGV